jgi:glycosyltransferase involved in cell wall biosynthesis
MLEKTHILAVHHDSGLNGATLLFQAILERLASEYGASVSLKFPREGPILTRARRLGPVHVPTSWANRPLTALLARAARRIAPWDFAKAKVSCDLVFANSVASLEAVHRMRIPPEIPLVVYVHESNFMFRQACDLAVARRVLQRARLIFAVSPSVQKTIEDLVRPAAKTVVVSGFAPVHSSGGDADGLPREVRAALSAKTRIIGGVGTMSWWKGTDLFIALSRRIRQLVPAQDIKFMWVGEEWSPSVRRQLEHDIARSDLEGTVLFLGRLENPSAFYRCLSVLLLPSREDAWPLVMLEAAQAGVPTVCFRNAGGAEDFVAGGGGVAVPYLDVEAMATAAARYLQDDDLLNRDAAIARCLGAAVTPLEQVRKIAVELAALRSSPPPR